MSRKRSLNELMDLRIKAAERANRTGSAMSARAAELANQYIGNIDKTKSVRRSYDRANEEFRKENILRQASNNDGLQESQREFLRGEAKKRRVNAVGILRKSEDRKYSQNTYKGLNKG